MKKVSISLVDSDFVCRAKADLPENEKTDALIRLIQCIDEEFVPGEAVHLEIEGLKENPITLEISH